MKAKTTPEPAKAKQPYNDAKRPRKRATKPAKPRPLTNPSSVSSSLSSSSSPSPSAPCPGAVLYRDLCLEKVVEWYPGLRPRNDYDLLELCGHHYTGTPAEIYAAIDEAFAEISEEYGYEFVANGATKTLDTYVEPTGLKPQDSAPADNKRVFIRPIPNTKYSFRLFPGSFSAAEYCMDFVETASGKPVNSPFEYELWGVTGDSDTPWLTMPICAKLRTIERAHGIKQESILPGAEKFVLRDGQTCVLIRPGQRSLRFTVPVRKRAAPPAIDDMDVADLPKFVDP